MSEYLDFIDIDFWHIVMSMGNLVILTAIVKKFLFKPVNDILNKRKQEVDNFYFDAKETLAAAQKDKTTYEGKLSAADKEAAEIINSAVQKADKLTQDMIADTKEKMNILVKKTESDIETKKRNSVLEMKNEISGLVINLAEKVVRREITADTHNELINVAIDNLYDD